MTRQIKFKVYDKQENKFIGEDEHHKLKLTFCNKGNITEIIKVYPVYISVGESEYEGDNYCGTMGGEPVKPSMMSLQMYMPESYEVEKWDNSRFEIIQFTGLHDKNGVEIYEHDIVSIRITEHIKQIKEIIYRDCEFGFDSSQIFSENIELIIPSMRNLSIFNTICEVIGNKLTHPELLEK